MINSLTLRQNYWTLGTFCTAYSRTLTTHHTIEDQYMFPELREKQASLGPVVERLEHEHEIIAEALARLDAALVTLVQDDGRIGEVQDLTAVLERILLSHLGYEEESWWCRWTGSASTSDPAGSGEPRQRVFPLPGMHVVKCGTALSRHEPAGPVVRRATAGRTPEETVRRLRRPSTRSEWRCR